MAKENKTIAGPAERNTVWSTFLCEGCDRAYYEGRVRVYKPNVTIRESLVCPKCFKLLMNGDKDLLKKIYSRSNPRLFTRHAGEYKPRISALDIERHRLVVVPVINTPKPKKVKRKKKKTKGGLTHARQIEQVVKTVDVETKRGTATGNSSTDHKASRSVSRTWKWKNVRLVRKNSLDGKRT